MLVFIIERKSKSKKRKMREKKLMTIERKKTMKQRQGENIICMGIIKMIWVIIAIGIENMNRMALMIELDYKRRHWKKLNYILNIREFMDLALEIWEISSGNRMMIKLMKIKIWIFLFVQKFQFILKMRLATMTRLRILFKIL